MNTQMSNKRRALIAIRTLQSLPGWDAIAQLHGCQLLGDIVEELEGSEEFETLPQEWEEYVADAQSHGYGLAA